MGDFAIKVSLFESIVGDTTYYFYVMLIFGSLIPLLFDGTKFVPASFYSVIISLVCYISVLFLGPCIASRIIMLIAVPCIGHIFISHVYAFFMVLNNSEKFFSLILVVLLPKVLMYIKPILSGTQIKLHPFAIFILLIMVTLAISTYFIKSHPETVPSFQKVKAPIKAYSLMPVVFIVFALNDVIAPAALQQMSGSAKSEIEGFYFWGILAGITVVLILQARFSVNICIMLNISFAFLAIGFVVDIIRMQYPGVRIVSAVCFGVAYSIGMVNLYYLTGVMIKKFKSIYFYRTGFLLSSICYLSASIFVKVTGQGDQLVAPPILMAFVSICIVILFFLLSPFFIKMLYSGEWIDDSYREDISQCTRLEARLKDYKLTPAEIEVCRLLLDGYTLRQISGILSKAYPTINTYCTSIYRKLNINSRTELFLLLQEYKQ
ncbi:MAG: helix-turn-helix transcriptional regulator [Clostridiaceae bacterium]|nr:helix-turn-helix transcriptional regulator [Clostridiaceae bacterium]